jgi:hypothetical protein
MFRKPQALAEICRNIAEVVFAILFISSFLESYGNLLLIILGFIFSVILWSVSLVLEKE